MPVVTATRVSRHYGAHVVLEDASLTIQRGERVGVVGANGAGKSTLARILAGIEAADGGLVTRRRDAEILYLEQSPDLPAGMSAREVALSGLAGWCAARQRFELASERVAGARDAGLAAATHEQAAAADDLERLGGWELVHRAESILGHLGIADADRDVARMSGGERRRVALARLLIARPDLAILDEPTNHLDVDTVDWLERHLLDDFDGAVLLITHDRYLLDRVAERTLEVSRGRVTSYDGGYETYLRARAERLAHEERTERNRQNFLRTELEWLRRQPKARSGKSKARIQRVLDATAQERPISQAVAQIAAAETRSGKTILELKRVSIGADGRVLAGAIDLYVTQGERIGVVGPNGCGKSTLLRCLVGEIEPAAGRIARGANTRIAYLDQTRSALDEAATVFENVIGDLASVRVGDREITPRSYLERFLFDDAGQRSVVTTLSGGERARVALAKLLAQPANLFILDEPTNDLDIPTLGALEEFLLESDGSAIVVTHDRYFLDRVATSILAFEDGRLRRFHGAYSDYLAQRAVAKDAPPPPRTETVPPASPPKAGAGAKLSYREQRELDALPDEIEALDARVASLEAQLAAPETYAERGRDVADLVSQLEHTKREVERLILRWEELETRKATRG
jgi:ABC transport system ATP-binding/permease protein